MTYGEAAEHNQILRPSRTYCAYCRKNQNWKPKHQEQASGDDITNIEGRVVLGVSPGRMKILTNIRVHIRDCVPKI